MCCAAIVHMTSQMHAAGTCRGVPVVPKMPVLEEPASADPDNIPPRSRLFLVVPKTAEARLVHVSVTGAAAAAATHNRGLLAQEQQGRPRGVCVERLLSCLRSAVALRRFWMQLQAVDGPQLQKPGAVACQFCRARPSSLHLQRCVGVQVKALVGIDQAHPLRYRHSCLRRLIPSSGFAASSICVCDQLYE